MHSLLPLSLLLLLSACSVHAAVHRIDVVHQHLPLNEPISRESRAQMAERHLNALTDIATREPLNLTDHSYTITGNVSLGSPAQQFNLHFDLWSPNLYVIDTNAVYYHPCQNSSSGSFDVTDKQTYDPSATSSCVSVNADFSSSDTFMNGSVVSDVLQMGDSLQTTVVFEDASLVNPWMQYYSYDGVFGLSSVPDANASTTLLGQLQSSLDSPVFTLSLDNCTGSENCAGQITLGGLAPDTCQGDSWTALSTVDTFSSYGYAMPVFNITGLSSTGSGCTNRVDIPMTVYVSNGYGTMFTSYQVLEFFVQASNATYNFSSGDYELSTDQVALAQPVYLNLPSGGVLQLNPSDYLIPSYNRPGTQYLSVYGWYNARERRSPHISLDTRFLSHYCLSKNFQTGVWSLGSRVSA